MKSWTPISRFCRQRASFDDYLRHPEHAGRLRHVVVTANGNIYGVIRVNTGLRRGLEAAHTGVSLGDVASRNFIRGA